LGSSQPFRIPFFRGPSSTTLDSSTSSGTAAESWRGTHLDIGSPLAKINKLPYPSPCSILPPPTANTIISAIVHTHTYIISTTTKKELPIKKKKLEEGQQTNYITRLGMHSTKNENIHPRQ
jgi:hypothetical protein